MLIDPDISSDILFWSAFQGLHLDPNSIITFQGYLVSLLGKQMLVKGHITLEKTFDLGVSSITIEVKYLVVDATPSLQRHPRKAHLKSLRGNRVHL